MVNAASKTNAIGWTMFANMFSGKNSAKMHWADILPFKVPGLDTGDHIMPVATERVLIRLVESEQLPRWAIDVAMRITQVSEAMEP